MNETAFNDWWNASYDAVDNPFKTETPAWWSWAAWKAATKVEREACAMAVIHIANKDAGNPYKQALRMGAEAIRARGNT